MRRSTTVLLALTLHACGVVVTEGPAAPPRADPAAPTPATPAPTPAGMLTACGAPRAHGGVLAWIEGDAVDALDARGATRLFHRFEGDAGWGVEQLSVSPDGFVAVSVTRRAPPGQQARYALLGPDGAVRWSATQETTLGGTPFRTTARLDRLQALAGGAVLAHHVAFDGALRSTTEWRSEDGGRRLLEGASVVAGPDAQGRMVVRDERSATATLRWWDPRGDAFSPWEGASGEVPFDVGAAVLGYERDRGGLTLVRYDAARASRFPLPFAAAPDELTVRSSNDAGWLLFTRRDVDDAAHRLDLRTGRLDALALRLPAGARPAYFSGMSLDDDGALLAVLRDDDWARLYRSEDGARWSPIGRPVRGTLGVQFFARSGTYVVRAHSNLYGGDTWGDTFRDEPDGLQGTSVQVVRPSTGASLVVRPEEGDDHLELSAGSDVSPNGRCVAWIDSRPGESVIHVVSLVDGARLRVERAAGAGRLVWL